MEDFFSANLKTAHLLIEILRTQAFVKGLAEQLLDTSQYSDLINAHEKKFLKSMIDFVENNRLAFQNPDDVIMALLKKMSE